MIGTVGIRTCCSIGIPARWDSIIFSRYIRTHMRGPRRVAGPATYAACVHLLGRFDRVLPLRNVKNIIIKVNWKINSGRWRACYREMAFFLIEPFNGWLKTGSPLSNPHRISRFFHSTAEFYGTRFYTCAYTTLIMSPPPSEIFSSIRSSISIFKSKDILYFFFLFQICHNFIIATFYQREALLPTLQKSS